MFNKVKTIHDEELKIKQNHAISEELTEEQLENVNGGSITFVVASLAACICAAYIVYKKPFRR